MPSRAPREPITVRLNAPGLARVRELADQETDGNLSLMVRKLLAEAIQHRDAAEQRAVNHQAVTTTRTRRNPR